MVRIFTLLLALAGPLCASANTQTTVNPYGLQTFIVRQATPASFSAFTSACNADGCSMQAYAFGPLHAPGGGNPLPLMLQLTVEAKDRPLSFFSSYLQGSSLIPSEAQITFSYYSLGFSATYTDGVSGELIEKKTGVVSGMESRPLIRLNADPQLLAGRQIITATYEVSFLSGNHLLPSPDPSCASFSCMIPSKAVDAWFTVGANTGTTFVTGIPEPSTYAMFGMGVIALLVLKRQRSGQNSQT